MVMPSTHATVNSSAHAIGAPSRVDPEVLEKPERRQFSAAYKLQILQETDSCQAAQIGIILRREGLYSSTVAFLLSDLGVIKTSEEPKVDMQNI